MSRQLRLLPRATEDRLERRRPQPLAVLEFESSSAAIVAAPVPPLSRLINLLVFLLVLAVLAASALIPVDKIVTATGKLVSRAPNIVIQSFGENIVESIEAREGDVVRKGEVLVRLNPTFTSADLTAIDDQIDLLSARTARLQAMTAGADYPANPSNPLSALQASIFRQKTTEFRFTLQNYERRIDQLQTKVDGGLSQAAIYHDRLIIASNLEDMHQQLQDRGAGSKLETLTARDERLTMAAAKDQAESDAAQATRELAALRSERDAFVQRWNGQNSQELADTRSQLVQAQQAHAKADRNSELLVLTAPRDAVVLSVGKFSLGSVVASGAPLLQLVPIDAPLSAEVNIAGIDSGYVRSGHEVRIKFDTLPFLQYGSAHGVVRAMSPDSFSPEASPLEGGSTLPSRPRTLYYKGDITLDQLALHDTPPGFRLMPGMPLVADVKVGTRSVLSYFIGKIIPVAQDSMHEPS